MSNTSYIYTLHEVIQDSIKADLTSIGLDQDNIEIAMNSRLSDLSDTIDINKYL